MRLIAALALILNVTSASAFDTDLGLNAALRTEKLAGAIEGQAGVSQVLWGTAGLTPNFGYIRTSAALRTSGLTNSLRVQAEVYPISILGITFGHQELIRQADPPGINCTRYDCGASLSSHFIQARGVYKIGEYFGQLAYYREFFDAFYYVTAPKVFEPTMQIGLDSSGDQFRTWSFVNGYQLNAEWAAGIVYQHAAAKISKETTESELLFARWKPNDYTYNFAIGRIQSTAIGVGPQFAFTVSWWPKARIGF